MTQPSEFPRDCAPSLHTAWALIALIAAWFRGRRFFLLVLPLGVMSIVTTLTLCKHYATDLVIAVPFALFCWWLAGLLAGRTRENTDAATLYESLFHGRTVFFLLTVTVPMAVFLWWASRRRFLLGLPGRSPASALRLLCGPFRVWMNIPSHPGRTPEKGTVQEIPANKRVAQRRGSAKSKRKLAELAGKAEPEKGPILY